MYSVYVRTQEMPKVPRHKNVVYASASWKEDAKQTKGIWLRDANTDNARLKYDETNMKSECGSLRNGMYVVFLFGKETPERLEAAPFEQSLAWRFRICAERSRGSIWRLGGLHRSQIRARWCHWTESARHRLFGCVLGAAGKQAKLSIRRRGPRRCCTSWRHDRSS